jgi:hypothetical protein
MARPFSVQSADNPFLLQHSIILRTVLHFSEMLSFV